MFLLYARNLKMLPKPDIVLPFKQKNISASQHKGRYSTMLVLQCKIMQHNTGGIVQ